ncbi:MFS general substrate transporter [Panus rudis PR-1116 ss-1]|nr:MFS general substrate transporter [Panus rudis PR-1116 ss-1]
MPPSASESEIALDVKNGTSTETPVPAEVPSEPEPEIEEGGVKAWMTIVGGWLAIFASFGYANAFGVYQDLYTRENAASASRISWIGSTQLFFLIATGLPAGKLFDLGYFRHTVITGAILYVFSIFMLSLAHPDKYYQLFLSQGVGMGIGAGMLYMPATAVQARHWTKRRPLAMGIVSSGSSAGGIVYPIMLNQLLHNGHTSFAWAVRASGFLTLGILVLACLLMFPGKPRPRQELPSLKTLFTDVPYVLTSSQVRVTNIRNGNFVDFYLQLYSILHGVDSTLAFYTLAIMNGASVFGRTLPNLLAQRIGLFNTLIPIAIICGVLIIALLGITSAAGIVVFAVLYGFFSGAYVSILSPTAAELSNTPGEVGLRMGVAFFFAAIGVLTGPPIDGRVLGPTFIWHKAVIFSAVRTSFSVVSEAEETKDERIGDDVRFGRLHLRWTAFPRQAERYPARMRCALLVLCHVLSLAVADQ